MAGPLSMPRALGSRTAVRERAVEGRFHFNAAIASPLVGPLIHFRGWLEPRHAATPAHERRIEAAGHSLG